jgi:rhomboid family GlyGly-CTERM serine protease
MISDASRPLGVPSRRRQATERVLCVLVAAAIAASALLPEGAQRALRYDRAAVEAGESWRLASAHFVHLGWRHALANGAAWILIVSVGRPFASPWAWLVLSLASAAGVDAGLLWAYPQVEWYVGASGVLHGLFAGSACLALAGSDVKRGALMLALLAAKLGWEAAGGGVLQAAAPDFPVLHEAHWLGAAGGLAGAMILLAGRRRR